MMLVDAVADWLLKRVQLTPTGARSLAHLMVVVPTAQAGRQLRLALARRAAPGGILPPVILEPMRLAEPVDSSLKTASQLEAAAVFVSFLTTANLKAWNTLLPAAPEKIDAAWALGLAGQLDGIWSALGANGLVMADVLKNPAAKNLLAGIVGDEVTRWKQLADLEAGYFDALHARGLRHRAEALKSAAAAPKPLPPGITEVVLPALVDPVPVLYPVLEALQKGNPALKLTVLIHAAADAAKFDAWGRPRVEAWTGKQDWMEAADSVFSHLHDGDIVIRGDYTDEAEAAAAAFPPPGSGYDQPALGLCDADLYPALESAFLAHDRKIHNPERHLLVESSLGRLVVNLVELQTAAAPSWKSFTAFLRADDVLDWLCPATRAAVLAELDAYQAAELPLAMPAVADLAAVDAKGHPLYGNLRATVAKLAAELGHPADVLAAIPQVLGRIFAHRRLFEKTEGRAGTPPGDRELAAAAEALMDLVSEMSGEAVKSLDAPSRLALFHHALLAATYQLEPETSAVLQTEGWLELAWSPARALVITGFTEGSVPDSIVGHPFLPDALRATLGLVNNDQRLARDTFILGELLASHAPGRIRLFCSHISNAKDVLKPSRLLFLCDDDALVLRVKKLFGDPEQAASTPNRELPPAWRLNLSAEVPPPDHLSPSSVDSYLKCPFTFFLQHELGMEPVKELRELGVNDFGTLCHGVLEDFGRDAAARDLADEPAIRDALLRFFAARAARFGAHPSAAVQLQLESARNRISAFAACQAARRAAGWRIRTVEHHFRARPFDDLPVDLKGTIDRIDVNDAGNFAVIDYKTWDSLDSVPKHLIATSKTELAFGGIRDLPVEVLSVGKGAGKKPKETSFRWLSVQLPLYGLLLEKSDPATFRGRLVDYSYAVLGATPPDVGWANAVVAGGDPAHTIFALRTSALDTAHCAFQQCLAGIFWPPGPSDQWQYDFAALFPEGPEGLVPDAWRAEQERRLAALRKGGAE